MHLVTGAAGLIGSAVVRNLARKGVRVIAAFRGGQYVHSGAGGVIPVRLDVANRSDFDSLRSRGVSAVVHLAAAIPSPEGVPSSRYLRDNVIGTSNVVDFCRCEGIRTLLFASSISVYGGSGVLREDDETAPLDDYGFSKLHGERTCLRFSRETGARVVSLRLSAVYGPGMRPTYLLPILVGKAVRGEDLVVWGDGASRMDYLHVDDAARAFGTALEGDASGTFNICSGEVVSVLELAESVRETFGGTSTRVLRDPSRGCARREMLPSPERAAREMGFSAAISLKEGLAWWKKSLDQSSLTLRGRGS